MTEIAWRVLAVISAVGGKKPAFTRETARSAHHCSYYSNAKLLVLYPGFSFLCVGRYHTAYPLGLVESKRLKQSRLNVGCYITNFGDLIDFVN